MELIPTAAVNEALTAQAFEQEAVVTAFLQQLDCKESSRKLYARTLPQYFAWANRTGRSLNVMTRADIIAYRDGLINGTATADGKTRSSLTAAAYLTAVKLFYKWLESVGAYPNITAGVKMPERSPKFEREPLTNEQARQLSEETTCTASYRDAAILSLLLRCGLRTIEVVRADVADLKERSGVLTLNVQGKGHISKNNFVVLSDKAAVTLRRYLNSRTDIAGKTDEELQHTPLFTCDSNNNAGGRLTTRTISGIAKKHLQAIGLDSREYTAHSLRHTFGCSLLDATDDMNIVQLSLRHASQNTTRLYVYHRDEQRRIAAAKKCSIDTLY